MGPSDRSGPEVMVVPCDAGARWTTTYRSALVGVTGRPAEGANRGGAPY